MSDLWRGRVSCKSHVSELKNWMPKHSKNKNKKIRKKYIYKKNKKIENKKIK